MGPITAGKLPPNIGTHPPRREGNRTPNDHLVVRLGKKQVEWNRCIQEAQCERLADLRRNVRFVGPEAGDPFGRRQRPPNRVQRGVDVEREE